MAWYRFDIVNKASNKITHTYWAEAPRPIPSKGWGEPGTYNVVQTLEPNYKTHEQIVSERRAKVVAAKAKLATLANANSVPELKDQIQAIKDYLGIE